MASAPGSEPGGGGSIPSAAAIRRGVRVWFMDLVPKTSELKGSGGSNPSLFANIPLSSPLSGYSSANVFAEEYSDGKMGGYISGWKIWRGVRVV